MKEIVPTLVADRLLGIDLRDNERRVLCVSTSMIPEHTAKALGLNNIDGIYAKEWDDIGWIFWVRPHDEFENYSETPVKHPELVALCAFAEERGFAYLQLTNDEAELPAECGLPVFSW